MTIHKNINECEALLKAIENHPMAGKVLVDCKRIRVIFPECDLFYGGVQCDFREGKIKAYRKVLKSLKTVGMKTTGGGKNNAENFKPHRISRTCRRP